MLSEPGVSQPHYVHKLPEPGVSQAHYVHKLPEPGVSQAHYVHLRYFDRKYLYIIDEYINLSSPYYLILMLKVKRSKRPQCINSMLGQKVKHTSQCTGCMLH